MVDVGRIPPSRGIRRTPSHVAAYDLEFLGIFKSLAIVSTLAICGGITKGVPPVGGSTLRGGAVRVFIELT